MDKDAPVIKQVSGRTGQQKERKRIWDYRMTECQEIFRISQD